MQSKPIKKRKHVPHIAEEGGEHIQKPASAHLPPVVAPQGLSKPPPPPRDPVLMLPKAYVRMSSRNRTPGQSRSDYSVILGTAVRRAVGFVPIYVSIYNTWPNISAALGNNTVSFSYNGGAAVVLTIADGAYYNSATANTFPTVLTAMVKAQFTPASNDFTFGWEPTTNQLYIIRTAGVAETLQVNLIGTTALAPLGLTANLLVNASDTRFYFQAMSILTDFASVAIGSSQLRMPVSIDTKTGGARNSFLTIPNTASKGSYLIYQNQSPTTLSVISLPTPSDFSYVSLQLFDPDSGALVPLNSDWEIQVMFLLAPVDK